MVSRGEAPNPGRSVREGIQEDVTTKWAHKHPNQERLDLKPPCAAGPEARHTGAVAEKPRCFSKSRMSPTLPGWGVGEMEQEGREGTEVT